MTHPRANGVDNSCIEASLASVPLPKRGPTLHREMRGDLRYGLRRGGRGKPVVTGRVGASQSADGSWAQVEQVVDTETKRYRKRVVLADGTVAKDVDGPIDQGHGDPRSWRRADLSFAERARRQASKLTTTLRSWIR